MPCPPKCRATALTGLSLLVYTKFLKCFEAPALYCCPICICNSLSLSSTQTHKEFWGMWWRSTFQIIPTIWANWSNRWLAFCKAPETVSLVEVLETANQVGREGPGWGWRRKSWNPQEKWQIVWVSIRICICFECLGSSRNHPSSYHQCIYDFNSSLISGQWRREAQAGHELEDKGRSIPLELAN